MKSIQFEARSMSSIENNRSLGIMISRELEFNAQMNSVDEKVGVITNIFLQSTVRRPVKNGNVVCNSHLTHNRKLQFFECMPP